MVAPLVDALPSGSYVAVTHPTADFNPEAMAGAVAAAEHGGVTLVPRSREETAAFFTGLDLVEPGVVPVLACGQMRARGPIRTVRITTPASAANHNAAGPASGRPPATAPGGPPSAAATAARPSSGSCRLTSPSSSAAWLGTAFVGAAHQGGPRRGRSNYRREFPIHVPDGSPWR